jgi:pyridoxamine 5'-phosphate oxidase
MGATDAAAPDPVAEIVAAREAARRAGDPCADVCYLLTVGPGGRPEGRALILRDAGARGFGVLISRTSPKWGQLERGPAALLIHWPLVSRQYRVAGAVAAMEAEESLRLWRMKSHESMLLSHYYAAVRPQSATVASRDAFLRGIEDLRARWPRPDAVPMPESVAGVRLVPREIETWHGAGESRLHDRRLYTRGSAGWTYRTLVP